MPHLLKALSQGVLVGAVLIGLPTFLLFRQLRWDAMLLWVATAAILPLLAMMVLLNSDFAWSPAQLAFYLQFLPGAACGWIIWYLSREPAD